MYWSKKEGRWKECKWYMVILQWLGALFLGFITLIVFGILLASIPEDKYHYEYIDLDNNKGIAEECSYKFEGYKKGGQGSPVCILEDGVVKQVKEYKYIYEETVVPLKEIWEW